MSEQQPRSRVQPQAAEAPDQVLLTVILPTYNEQGNIGELVGAIFDALGDTPVEVLVVDDASPDGTGEAVEALAGADPRVGLLQRGRKQGLAGAVFAGAESARGTYIGVMDADLSHDPVHLPGMLAKAQEGYDVVIGSRFVQGGEWSGQRLVRRLASVLVNRWAKAVLRLPQHDVLTGYVLCRRDLVTGLPTRYSSGGFKWLVELLASRRDATTFEWPIVFRARRTGYSKANVGEAVAFLALTMRLALRRRRA